MESPKEISIDIDGTLNNDQLTFEEFKAFLNILDQQDFIEKPVQIEWSSGKKRTPITQYCEEEVFQQPWKHCDDVIHLEDKYGNTVLSYCNEDYRNSYSFRLRLFNLPKVTPILLKQLLKDLSDLKCYDSLTCALQFDPIHDMTSLDSYKLLNFYPDIPWFTFYSHKELKRLKDEGRKNVALIYTNPFAQITKTKQGIIQQIGDSPMGILTNEGRGRFYQAKNYLDGLIPPNKISKYYRLAKKKAQRYRTNIQNKYETSVEQFKRNLAMFSLDGNKFKGNSGRFIDSRDNQEYKWVRLKDNKIWMVQNLNYEENWRHSRYYKEDANEYEQYGRLYTWESAQKACPRGWRIPTELEWRLMILCYGIEHEEHFGQETYEALVEGGRSGFDAQLGGMYLDYHDYEGMDKYGHYWTNSEESDSNAWSFTFDGYHNKDNSISRFSEPKSTGLSCRCIKDTLVNDEQRWRLFILLIKIILWLLILIGGLMQLKN